MTSPSRTWTSQLHRTLSLAAVAALTGIAFTGCSATSKRDVLESRLRHQEDMISRYQSQLDRAKTELDIARRDTLAG